jgi:hypothetical protein
MKVIQRSELFALMETSVQAPRPLISFSVPFVACGKTAAPGGSFGVRTSNNRWIIDPLEQTGGHWQSAADGNVKGSENESQMLC